MKRAIWLKVIIVVLAVLVFSPAPSGGDYVIQVAQDSQENEVLLLDISMNDFNLPEVTTSEQSVQKTDESFMREIGLSKEYQSYLYSTCEENGVDYIEALSVLTVENRQYNPDAVNVNSNGSQDVGLFQINTINHEWLKNDIGVTNLYDPYQNIHAGVHMLSLLGSKYEGHTKYMAYNFGEGGAKKALKRGQYSSSYSRKVMKQIEEFRSEE